MRTAAWETSAGALAALLNSATQVFMADLFTFTSPAGAVLARWTSADIAGTVAGNTYTIGPAITRGKTSLAAGIQTDTLEVKLAADASVLVGTAPLLPFIAGGGFDNCRMVLDRAFAAAPPAWGGAAPGWIGTLNLFGGRVSETTVSRYAATLSIASDSELLDVMVPRNLYAPGCGNTLFDGTCGLAKASHAYGITATSGTDVARTSFGSGSGAASGFFALGWLVCTAGANAGVNRTVKFFDSGTFTVIQPWPLDVAPGDVFTAYPGCDKTLATCTTKFANALRFRGQPFVPPPETVI